MNQNGVIEVIHHLTCSEGSPVERSLTRCGGGGAARRLGSASSVADEVGGDAPKFVSVLGTTTGSLSWVSAGDDGGDVDLLMSENSDFCCGCCCCFGCR